MFNLGFAAAFAMMASATLALSIPASPIESPTIQRTDLSKNTMCKLVHNAGQVLLELREKQAIYKHHHGYMGSEDIMKRSSSETWACANALYKAEQYATVHSEALQELLAATEELAPLSRSTCGRGSADSTSAEDMPDVYNLLVRYMEADSQFRSIDAEFDRLGLEYGYLCLESVQQEFDQGVHDEL